MSTIPEPERVDLCDVLGPEFGAIVQPSPAIAVGEIWMGPVECDALRAFGPGTTDGGRAEAGWFLVGRLTDDGPAFTPDRDPLWGPGPNPHGSALTFGDPSRQIGQFTPNGIEQ